MVVWPILSKSVIALLGEDLLNSPFSHSDSLYAPLIFVVSVSLMTLVIIYHPSPNLELIGVLARYMYFSWGSLILFEAIARNLCCDDQFFVFRLSISLSKNSDSMSAECSVILTGFRAMYCYSDLHRSMNYYI